MGEAKRAPRTATSEDRTAPDVATVQVWDWPLRLWHWSLAILVAVAWVTPNVYDGLHQFAGYAVIGLLAFRLVWGFFGKRHSRFDKIILRLRAAPNYLRNLRRGDTGRYLGLNPAGVAMLVAMLALLAISTVSGAMQVTVRFFGVWWIEDTHAYSSHAVIVLAGLHVLGTLLMSKLQRENLVRAMVTGRKHPPGATLRAQARESTDGRIPGQPRAEEAQHCNARNDGAPSVIPGAGAAPAAEAQAKTRTKAQSDPAGISD